MVKQPTSYYGQLYAIYMLSIYRYSRAYLILNIKIIVLKII